MASPVAAASRRPALFLILAVVALTAAGEAGAAKFVVINMCPYPVWPAAIPTGGGVQLNPGQPWVVTVPAGTKSARIWARTDCHFVGDHGRCGTGDCAGALRCQLSGKPPATLAEFTIGVAGAGLDYYDVSVVTGFNVPMDFSCDNAGGGVAPIRCRDPGCADGNHGPSEGKVRTCRADSDYHVVFCPP